MFKILLCFDYADELNQLFFFLCMNLFLYYLFDFSHVPKQKNIIKVNSKRIILLNQSLAGLDENSSLITPDGVSSQSISTKSALTTEEVQMNDEMEKELLKVFKTS